MTKKQIFGLFLATFCAMTAFAQDDEKPKVSPMAYYLDKEQQWTEATTISDGEAPLEVTFCANPTNMGSHTPSYEWHFHKQSAHEEDDKGDFLVRYEEETTYRFVESGTFDVTLICRLSDTGELVDSATVVVAISESRLVMPNAFSTPSSTGRPWVSQPALRGTKYPFMVRYLGIISLITRVSTWPICGLPLAVGGPS